MLAWIGSGEISQALMTLAKSKGISGSGRVTVWGRIEAALVGLRREPDWEGGEGVKT
jgi:hypothetical protein